MLAEYHTVYLKLWSVTVLCSHFSSKQDHTLQEQMLFLKKSESTERR